MYSHPAEKYYAEIYLNYFLPLIPPSADILDAGCENGRFTIPLAKKGFTITATEIKSSYFDFIRANIPADA